MTNLYILNNRISGVLTKEVKKAIPTPKIKAVLGGDGIWCRSVYQSGGTGSEKFDSENLEKQLQGRIWRDLRTKRGTSGFEITLDFVIYPHETLMLPRIWETSYEEIIDTRRREVWEELNIFNKSNLSPGSRILVRGQEGIYLGVHSNSYLNCTNLGNFLDRDIEVLIEV